MAAATTPTCSLPEIIRLRVMCAAAVAVIMTKIIGGSNAGIAKEQVTFVALNVMEAGQFCCRRSNQN
jgi:hypothetical protein